MRPVLIFDWTLCRVLSETVFNVTSFRVAAVWRSASGPAGRPKNVAEPLIWLQYHCRQLELLDTLPGRGERRSLFVDVVWRISDKSGHI